MKIMSNVLDNWVNFDKTKWIKWNYVRMNFSGKTVLDSSSCMTLKIH